MTLSFFIFFILFYFFNALSSSSSFPLCYKPVFAFIVIRVKTLTNYAWMRERSNSDAVVSRSGRVGVVIHKTCGIRVNTLSPFLPFFLFLALCLYRTFIHMHTAIMRGLSYTWWKITIESSFAFSVFGY